MENKTINIAAITDDGVTISQHFGRARYYEALFIENGQITKRERREKPGHQNFAHEKHEHSGTQHGFDESSRNKHKSMAECIKDCRILLAGGMGNGAYQSMLQFDLKPIITNIKNIDDAVQEVISGTIVNHIDRLH